MRINKLLALRLGISRREADEAIVAGRVAISGAKAPLGAAIAQGDVVSFDGTPLQTETALVYIMLHKPVGYVCSRRQQGSSTTIYALMPPKYHHLKPVGRLDRDSSGLLILTNDGDFAHRMTHPSFKKTKSYEIVLNKPLTLEDANHIRRGVHLPDGVSKLELRDKSQESRKSSTESAPTHDSSLMTHNSYVVAMHEGRNRQIRRTFGALGYAVTALHRTQFGDFELKNLKPGEFKKIQKA